MITDKDDRWRGLTPELYSETVAPQQFDRFGRRGAHALASPISALLGEEHREPAFRAYGRALGPMSRAVSTLPILSQLGAKPSQSLFRAFELAHNRPPTQEELSKLFGILGEGMDTDYGTPSPHVGRMPFGDRAEALHFAAANELMPKDTELEEWAPDYFRAARAIQRAAGGIPLMEALQILEESGFIGVRPIDQVADMIEAESQLVRMRDA